MQTQTISAVIKRTPLFLIGIASVFVAISCRQKKTDKTAFQIEQESNHIQTDQVSHFLRGNQSAEVGGIFISDLREMLDALYEGPIPLSEANLCVFTFEAQCSARVDYFASDYAICSVMGGEAQPFAIEIDGSESELLSGHAIRYIRNESFTNRNGIVRMIPVFKSECNVNPEPEYDDSQYKAIKPE